MGPLVTEGDGTSGPRLWRLCALAVAVVGAGLYAQTLTYELVWDDRLLVPYVERLVREGGPLSVVKAEFRLQWPLGYYRPVALGSLWLDGQLGAGAPWVYHLTNVALHGVNSALVLGLLRALGLALPGSVCGALLFAVHPAHVESVAFVSGRTDLWAAAFGLTAAILWARAGEWTGKRRIGALAFSGVAFALGLLSKEAVFVLPAVLLAWDGLGLRGRGRGWWGRNAGWIAVWGAGLAVVLALRWWSGVGLGAGEVEGTYSKTLLRQPGLAAAVWATYARLLVLPWPLNAYYTVDDMAPAWTLLAWAAAVAACLYRAGSESRRWGWGAFAWAAGFLLPVSGLIPLKGSLLAERFLYLPSVALSLVVARFIAIPSRRWRAAALAAALGVAALWGVGSAVRSAVWRDDVALFRDMVRHSPRNALAHNELGVAYDAAGRREDALGEYREAIRLSPGYAEAHFNLGNAYAKLGLYREAWSAFLAAVSLRPEYADAYNNLGLAYLELGMPRDAVQALQQAIRLRPRETSYLQNLAEACREAGDEECAREALRRGGASGGLR